ncbi:group 1 glycosyl transferase [Taibaiella sp. KBW10]|nr:group 1 glycosyl transferase [Taibaiella sp. KBW10]
MIRICTTLAEAGYHVTLIGVKKKNSKPLINRPFHQKRLPVLAESGKLFYGGYWIILFFYLLFKKAAVICAIDLDTIMSVLWASKLKGCKRVYDAHEIFTEMKEVVTKSREAKIWNWIADYAVPQFPVGYTVGNYCGLYLHKRHGVTYPTITNATVLRPLAALPDRDTAPFILYQGAVNKGRCFEQLIPAMQWVETPLLICGEGNFFEQAQELARTYKVTHKITFKGYVPPDELYHITRKAKIGLILLDSVSQNNVYSLANRLFDYMHNAVPQLSMDYPEYRAVNEQYEIALLLPADPSPELIAKQINYMLEDRVYYDRLVANSLKARQVYNWQENEKTLLYIYQNLLTGK